MDLLFEFIAEILGESAIELIKSKKVPFIIRAILFIIISAIYLSIIALIIYITIKNNSLLPRIILILISILLLGIYIGFVYKLIKDNKERK